MTVQHGLWPFLLTLLCSYAFAAPTSSPGNPSDEPPKSGQYSARNFLTQFSGLKLVDQNNRPFNPRQLQNRIVLVNFIFTHCGATCPIQTKALAEVMETLPEQTRQQLTFVSISLDPSNDSPAKLKQFAQQFNADAKNWFFLTGNEKHIQTLTDNLLVLTADEAPTEAQPIVHNASLWLVDANGRMLQRYRGDPPDKARLVRELSQVVQLALNSRINASL